MKLFYPDCGEGFEYLANLQVGAVKFSLRKEKKKDRARIDMSSNRFALHLPLTQHGVVGLYYLFDDYIENMYPNGIPNFEDVMEEKHE